MWICTSIAHFVDNSWIRVGNLLYILWTSMVHVLILRNLFSFDVNMAKSEREYLYTNPDTPQKNYPKYD